MDISAGLIDKIEESWQTHVKEDIHKNRINSERALQASFWKHLTREDILGDDYEVFVEPLELTQPENIRGMRPDIVICRDQTIEAIIEIKFNYNGGGAEYKNDLLKLAMYQKECGKETYLRVIFGKNDWDRKHAYTISTDVLCIFAAVAHEKSDIFNSEFARVECRKIGLNNALILCGGYNNGTAHSPDNIIFYSIRC